MRVLVTGAKGNLAECLVFGRMAGQNAAAAVSLETT